VEVVQSKLPSSRILSSSTRTEACFPDLLEAEVVAAASLIRSDDSMFSKISSDDWLILSPDPVLSLFDFLFLSLRQSPENN
jgi:hypothetical protein